MYQHHEIKTSRHEAQHLYDLVKDVRRYPEFLPWCRALRVRKEAENYILADLQMGYKFFSESFTSEVWLNPDDLSIKIDYRDGPFKSLESQWQFESVTEHSQQDQQDGHQQDQQDGQLADGSTKTLVDFSIAFSFRNVVLENLLGPFFEEAVKRMVSAFEKRADQLYP